MPHAGKGLQRLAARADVVEGLGDRGCSFEGVWRACSGDQLQQISPTNARIQAVATERSRNKPWGKRTFDQEVRRGFGRAAA